MSRPRWSRRRFLEAGGVLGTSALAGCGALLDDPSPTEDDDSRSATGTNDTPPDADGATSTPDQSNRAPIRPVQVAKLVPPGGEGGNHFGNAAAAVRDTAVLAARYDDSGGGSRAGSVQVFERRDGEWTHRIELIARDGRGGEKFGRSVAMTEGTVLVGALDAGLTDAEEPELGEPDPRDRGAAYVFERGEDRWTQRAKLGPTDDDAASQFGENVALADGTAVIGDYATDEPNGEYAGAAYVFERSNGDWARTAKLAPEDGEPDDHFGSAVATTGVTALVGATTDEDGGSAYVYRNSDGSWSEEAKLLARDGTAGGRFGESVAITNGTAVVGAPEVDLTAAEQAGAVYVFSRSGADWSQEAKLVADDAGVRDHFGRAVELTGEQVVVGAPGAGGPEGLAAAGSAYVFERAEDGWTQRARLTADDADSGDRFGQAVALTDDAVLAGAPDDEDPLGTNHIGEEGGSAYAFDLYGA